MKACEVALMRIGIFIMRLNEEGVKRAAVPNLSLTFQRSRARGLTEYYGRTRAERNTRYIAVYTLFLANNNLCRCPIDDTPHNKCYN